MEKEKALGERLSRFRSREIGLIGERIWRKYAVLVPIVDTKEGPCILFERRSHRLRKQPGEVSFPGGAIEGAESAEEAAVRETCEELLISRRQIEVYGAGDIFLSPGNRRIDPFLGRLTDYRGEYSTDEVAYTFLAPIAELRQITPEVYRNRINQLADETLPFDSIPRGRDYQWESGESILLFYRWRKEIIWGITARILQSSLELIDEYRLLEP